ncbi:MAG: type I-E CRISPR-associated protein Cse2/CasB [Acidobacteriaceae bacterium]|nr:type I-E CRISPR-associated protein Cse2/CasB [Acidobacteriaceae bacterium]
MNLRYLSEDRVEALKLWFDALQLRGGLEEKNPWTGSRGIGHDDRVQLRRARSVEDLERGLAANMLVTHLLRGDWKNNLAKRWFEANPLPLLMIAGVLATVREDTEDGKSLAWRAGRAFAEGNRAPMSEIRFRRLLEEQRLESFFLLVRRAVELAGGNVDVTVLADDLIAWAYEQELPASSQAPAQSMCFRWAQDYYAPDHKLNSGDLPVATEKIAEGEMVP